MHTIDVRNVIHALPLGIRLLEEAGIQRDSRNGPVKVAQAPVTTLYRNPKERVMFYPERDCNPFFHLFESLWMLGGRNDTTYVCNIVKTMMNFSDDGEVLWGAYGWRWRSFFGYDQLPIIAEELRKNPESRRCVLGIWNSWDAEGDGEHSMFKTTNDLKIAMIGGKDVPCNTQVYFSRGHEGELNMTVCNRSNDVVWGAYGANAVHFSYLLEFMAAWIGCPVGKYWQISNNFHGYLNTYEPLKHLAALEGAEAFGCRYTSGEVAPFPLVNGDIGEWQRDLQMFLEEGEKAIGYTDAFFRRVAVPMMRAFRAFKDNEGVDKYLLAKKELKNVSASDWRIAAQEWIDRRHQKFIKLQRAKDDGVDYQND